MPCQDGGNNGVETCCEHEAKSPENAVFTFQDGGMSNLLLTPFTFVRLGASVFSKQHTRWFIKRTRMWMCKRLPACSHKWTNNMDICVQQAAHLLFYRVNEDVSVWKPVCSHKRTNSMDICVSARSTSFALSSERGCQRVNTEPLCSHK